MKVKYYGDEARLDYCPVCQKTKKNPCFSVNTTNGLYTCHSSGKSGHIDDFPEIKKEIKIEATNTTQKKEKQYNNFDYLFQKYKPLNEKWITYLNNRGITNIENIKRFAMLGKNDSLMMPLTNGEHVVGVKYRSIDKKLWSETGSSFDYLMNWQNVKNDDYIIIVEGEIDLMSVMEAGIDNVVSLPGGATNLKAIENQKEWFKQFKKIIIATDNDEPGYKARDGIIEILKDTRIPIHKTYFYKKKDVNEVLMASGTEKVYDYLLNKCSKVKTGYKSFYENEGCYFYLTEDKMEKITDFTIELTGFSENYLMGISKSRDKYREFKVKISEILNIKGMAENIGLYLGSQSTIPRFVDFLKSENEEKFIKEIKHYGIQPNVNDPEIVTYYDEESEIICDKRDLKITNQSEIEPLTIEEKEWLENNLIYMRDDVNQSLLGICWALGRFHTLESYPILEVAGTTSIGKTEYVEFISRILFGGKENIKSLATLSNHQIRSFSSCSNITPWVIDEVKITGKNQAERTAELYSTIRAVYDNKVINQGNTTSKLTEFHLCTPLIISGETELNDVSIKNRMISTKLTKKNKGAYEIFKKLKTTNILEKLGKAALMDRLGNGIIKVNDSILQIADERQKYNATCLLRGLKALARIIKIETKVIDNFIDFINSNLSQEFNTIENFKMLLELARDSNVPLLSNYYRRTKDEHWANFQELYKIIEKEKRNTNSTLELLDMRTLRKQLAEEGYIVADGKRIRTYLINELGVSENKQIRATIFQPLTQKEIDDEEL